MTIPKLTPYTGQVANPDGSQTQTEFTQNMFDQLSYEAQLATELDATIDGMNNAVDEVEANAVSAQNSANAAEAAAASAGYQGLWPDTGGSALKGEIWQTQVVGTPTGEYYTALQNTSVDPVGDNVNWKVQNDLNTGNLSDYTDIVYKASGGNSAVENMLTAKPDMGVISSTGSGVWQRVSGDGSSLDHYKEIQKPTLIDFKSESSPTYDQALIDLKSYSTSSYKVSEKESRDNLSINFGEGTFKIDSESISLDDIYNASIAGEGGINTIFDITDAPDGFSLIEQTQGNLTLRKIKMKGFTVRSENTDEKHAFKVETLIRGGEIDDIHTYNLLGKPDGYVDNLPVAPMHLGGRIFSEFSFKNWSAQLDFDYDRDVIASDNYSACTFYGNSGAIEHWNVVSQFKYGCFARGVTPSGGVVDTGEGVRIKNFNAAGWDVTPPEKTMHRAVSVSNCEQGLISDGYVEGLESNSTKEAIAIEVISSSDVAVKRHILNSGGVLFDGNLDVDYPFQSRANTISSIRYGDTLRGVYFKNSPRVQLELSGIGRQTETLADGSTAMINPEFQSISAIRESDISKFSNNYLDSNPFFQNIGGVTNPTEDNATFVSGDKSWTFTVTSANGGQRFTGTVPGAQDGRVYTLTMYAMCSSGGDMEIIYRSGNADRADYRKLLNHRPYSNLTGWQTLRFVMEFTAGDTYDFVIKSNIAGTQIWVDSIFIDAGYTQKAVKVS